MRMLPIDYGLIRTQDLISGSFLRMYIGSGSIQLSIHARHKSAALTFGNEESACEVQVAAADLECDQMRGKGFTIRRKNFKSKLLKAVRMPVLPGQDIKIAMRPRGGLNIGEVSRFEISRAIVAAANVSGEDVTQDVICPNKQQT
ncbi:unnamed protein product [Ixodes pacificus]